MCVCMCLCACMCIEGVGVRERTNVGEETRSRKHVSGTSARRGSSAGVTRLSAACKQHEFIRKEGERWGRDGKMTDTDD